MLQEAVEAELCESISRLSREVERWREKWERQRDDVDEGVGTVQSLTRSCAELEESLRTCRAALEEKDRHMAELEAETQGYKERHEEWKASAEAEMERNRSEIAQLREQVQDLTSRCEESREEARACKLRERKWRDDAARFRDDPVRRPPSPHLPTHTAALITPRRGSRSTRTRCRR